MRYLYYKAKAGNFGDDLNAWLWPQIFRGTPEGDGKYFIGIGSLLFNESSLLKKIDKEEKIVFGTGVRPGRDYSALKINDGLWDIKFLRGPLSAMALGNKYDYIADAAYALTLVESYNNFLNTPKKYKVSLMPYFHSVNYFDWEGICKKLGYHYISPLSENGVEFTLKEIAASERMITEAMHGAIAADILRVPWHRFVLTTPYTEGERISDFKWNDWLYSIKLANCKATVIHFYRQSFLHKWIKSATGNMLSVNFYLKFKTKADMVTKLGKIDDYSLSENEVIDDIRGKIAVKAQEVIKENTSN